MFSPIAGKFLAVILLAALWLQQFQRVNRLVGNLPYPVAADQRDRRKARFYYQSMWVGIGVTLLSFLALETLQGAIFDSTLQRDWILSVARGLGLWGLITIAMIWSQVGIRASQPNSDGQSLMPQPEPKQDSKS
jgi:hypothetical protein